MIDDVPKGFSYIPLLHDSAYVIMRKGHPFAAYEKIPPTMLNGCNFIMPVVGYDDVINTVMAKAPFYPNIKYYTGRDAGAISMVSNNMGISVISSLQVNLLPSNVIFGPFQGSFGRNLGIAIKSLRHAPSVIKEFVRICRETASQIEQNAEEG